MADSDFVTEGQINELVTAIAASLPEVPWTQVTQAEYDALTPDSGTWYVVVG